MHVVEEESDFDLQLLREREQQIRQLEVFNNDNSNLITDRCTCEAVVLCGLCCHVKSVAILQKNDLLEMVTCYLVFTKKLCFHNLNCCVFLG
jgi:hypothetical protein